MVNNLNEAQELNPMNEDKPQNLTPIIDGHNDVLLRLYRLHDGDEEVFFRRNEDGHLDLPRILDGGFAGGFFAVFVPPPRDPKIKLPKEVKTKNGYYIPPFPPIEFPYAQQTAMAMTACLVRVERRSEGQLKIVHTIDELKNALAHGVVASILHFEGAEPIDTSLDALDVFYRAGLRSLGIVWSRPNDFAHGVEFRFPNTPDIGPGLSDAGKDLVHACNRLGIMIDLAHLNEKGFWDVAGLSDAPLVSTHTAVHTLTPSSRNLTDKQIDAIGESGGVIGVNFAVQDLRSDGVRDDDTPLTEVVRHARYIADRIGIDHVALGSDFDGATVSEEIGDAAGLPDLVKGFQAAGFDEAAVRKVTHENWLRVLAQTWK